MIKQLILIYFISVNFLTVNFVLADDASSLILQHRLGKINNLYMHFIQKINDVDKNILGECHGELWIKRPNLFYWHTMHPEEHFLISDGEALWFYVPIVKQVTVYCMKSISDNIFWVLFIGNNTSVWHNYNVFQQGDYFFLNPVNDSIKIKECKIKITNDGIIEHFNITESNGECIDYYLSEQNNYEIDIFKFSFNVPNDVQLDDQR